MLPAGDSYVLKANSCFAGVVGLAICRALALEGKHVVLLEQAKAIGTETSSRNSEVIHSGEQVLRCFAVPVISQTRL